MRDEAITDRSADKSSKRKQLILLGVGALILGLALYLALGMGGGGQPPAEDELVAIPVNPENPDPFRNNPDRAKPQENAPEVEMPTQKVGPGAG